MQGQGSYPRLVKSDPMVLDIYVNVNVWRITNWQALARTPRAPWTRNVHASNNCDRTKTREKRKGKGKIHKGKVKRKVRNDAKLTGSQVREVRKDVELPSTQEKNVENDSKATLSGPVKINQLYMGKVLDDIKLRFKPSDYVHNDVKLRLIHTTFLLISPRNCTK